MASVLDVLVIGHSFVRRVDYHLRAKEQLNLLLPTSSHLVNMIGKGGAHVSDLMQLFNSRSSNPHLVIIDVGTNDLANLHTPSHVVARQLFSVARTLVERYGVEHVVLMEVLPRTTWGRHGAPPSFTGRVKRFNDMIKSLVSHYKDRIPVSYWFHKGLVSNIEGFIQDGVHLTPGGLAKYSRSLRRAIVKLGRGQKGNRHHV